MNVLVQFSDTISPVFHWVLETSLQASVVVVLILLTQWLLRHRLPVRWYYGLWLALVIRLILPVAPESPLSIFNLIDQGWEASSTYFVTGEVAQEAITTPDTLLATPATYTPTESLIVTTQSAPSTQAAVTATSKVPTSSDNTTTLSPDQATTLSMHWQGVLSLVWFVGVCLLVTYVLLINLWYTLRLRYAAPVEDTTLLAVFEDSATRMKTSGVRLFESHLLKSPAIFGFYRPKLLLPPQAVQELTPQELRYVFLHELAHVRRKDIVMNWFCTLLLALHWFNPVLWFAFRRIRHDRELACDDFALRHTESGEAQAYGMTMLSLLRKHQKAAPFPGMAGLAGVVEAHSATGNRIRRIAAFRYDGRTWSMLAIAVSLIFGTVTLTNAQNPSDAGLVSQPSSQEEHDILLVAALNRADCANHLREWGLIFKMYASDNRGLFPLFSKDAGYLMPEPTLVYPDYVKDMRILICPARSPVPDIPVNPLSDASLRTHFQSSDYYYLGYALRDDTDVEAFAAAYQVSVETGEVLPDILQATSEDGEKRHILRLNEGVERFFITDINSPATSTRAQSAIPVMMDKLGNHPDGGNVLYMDGHIEFVQYGVWPMTERTHNALASLAALHEADSQQSSQVERDNPFTAVQNRARCAEHLKQWGLIFKMNANENRGLFPMFSKDAGCLMPEPTLVCPDYVNDLQILYCPAHSPVPDIPVNPLSDADLRIQFQSSDYYYLGYVLNDDGGVEAFAAAYLESIETGEALTDILEVTSQDEETLHIRRLREGVERFFITDINNPAAASHAQSAIPVMMDKLGNHPDGGNVLYMDGHIEFVQYGVWPMTERTHNALASLAALHGKTMVTTTTERPVASGMSRGMGMGGVQEGLYGARRAQQPEPEKNKEEIIKSLVEQLRVHLSAETAQELFRLGWWPEDDTLLLVRYLVSLQRIYGLEKYGDLTVETFSEYNKQTMPEEEILKHLVDTLRKIDTPAASVLLREIYQKRLGRLNDLLITGGKDARKSSVVELGSRGYPEALPPLRMALHDVEEEVRNAAIVAIGRLNTDEASATLGALLVAVPRTNVRGWPNPYISLSTQALLEMDTELGLPILYRKVIEQDLDENWCKNTAWEIIQRLGENPRDSRFDIFGPNEKSGWQERFEAWAMSHSSVFGLPEHNSSAMPIREFTEDELSRDFRFAVGQPGNPVESGILKLYCIGWGFVHEYDLGLVENGMLNFTFTPEMLVGRLSDRQTNDLSYENLIDFLTMGRRTFVVALSLPDNHWYRAPDQVLTEEFKIYREQNIPLDELITLYWKEVLHMVYTGISGMAAEVASTQSGISTMILPELEERVILILDENGTPMTNKEVRLAVYMTTENHCGGHHGLALGTFSTDTNGEIHVIAPALPLYLEEALYYDPDGIYAGIPVYLGREGLMIGPNPLEVVQKAWPENFEPRDLHLTVLDSNGTPMPDVTVHVRLRLQVCGAISRQHGRSGEDGIVHLHLLEHQVPPIARLVELWRYQDNDEGVFIDQDINRPLLEEELADLFANGHTTIVWDYEESLAQNNSV